MSESTFLHFLKCLTRAFSIATLNARLYNFYKISINPEVLQHFLRICKKTCILEKLSNSHYRAGAAYDYFIIENDCHCYSLIYKFWHQRKEVTHMEVLDFLKDCGVKGLQFRHGLVGRILKMNQKSNRLSKNEIRRLLDNL